MLGDTGCATVEKSSGLSFSEEKCHAAKESMTWNNHWECGRVHDERGHKSSLMHYAWPRPVVCQNHQCVPAHSPKFLRTLTIMWSLWEMTAN